MLEQLEYKLIKFRLDGRSANRMDEFVLDSLMLASMPVVIDEDRNGFAKVWFTEEDETAQALLFIGTNKAFRKDIAFSFWDRSQPENLPQAVNGVLRESSRGWAICAVKGVVRDYTWVIAVY